MDFSDRHAKLNKRLMESWGYSLDEKKTEKGFGEGTPPEGEWYDKKVVVMEDHDLDHPGMCCADAHSGQEHGAWATTQQQGRTEAPAIVSLEEDDNLEEYKAGWQEDGGYARKYQDDEEAKKRREKEKRQEKEEKRSAKKEGLEEGELPPGLEKYKKEKEGGSDDDSSAEASSDDDDDDIVKEPDEAEGAENERKKRDEPRNYVGRPGHVQNPLHEHEELVKRVVERVVARLQKS